MKNCSKYESDAYDKYEAHGSRTHDIYVSVINKNPENFILFSLENFKNTIIGTFICKEFYSEEIESYLSPDDTHFFSVKETEEILLKQCIYHLCYCINALDNEISYHLPVYEKIYKKNSFNMGGKHQSPQKISNTLKTSRKILSKKDNCPISGPDPISLWDGFLDDYYSNIEKLQNIIVEMEKVFFENKDNKIKKYTLGAAIISCILAAAFGCVSLYSDRNETSLSDQPLPSSNQSTQD